MPSHFYKLYRQVLNRLVQGACVGAVVLALVPLGSLLVYVIVRGWHEFGWSFFKDIPAPVGIPGGGMANAIVGTFEILGMATLVGLPVGLLAGIYLAEFGKASRWASIIRFTSNVLSGVPSIVTGVVVYYLVVRPMGGFSAIAGGIALGVMMIPIITRATEEIIKMVPNSIREASLALGISQWKTIVYVVLQTAKNGIITGVLLAIARVGGETAPLLFTAFGNAFWAPVTQPTGALTIQIYTYAVSPYHVWHEQAWTGALVLLMIVLVVNIMARLFFKTPRHLLR
jgi:phosphate transport system permease protein